MSLRSLICPIFVPGDRPERFAKAASSGADAVIIDLEDAVAAGNKEDARKQALNFSDSSVPLLVRINPLDTAESRSDIDALSNAKLQGLMVAKAEDPVTLRSLSAFFGFRLALVPLIETAAGLIKAREIATIPGVCQLAFGSIDYAMDLGCSEEFQALLQARSEIVLASSLANLDQPIDGVTTAIGDVNRLREDAANAKRLGFGGKLLIHPAQVSHVYDVFLPTSEEVRWAKRVLAAADAGNSGAVALDGHMVDRPVVERARRVLSRSKLYYKAESASSLQ